MVSAAYNTYRNVQAQTAPAAELTVLLYQGCIRFLVQAAAALDRRDIEGAHNGIMRAEAILDELLNSLDLEAGPVAQNLQDLYQYMLRRTVEANCTKNRAPIDEIVPLLRDLLEVWQQAFAAAGGRQRHA